MTITIDIETASTTPINNGLDNYASTARLLCMAWAIDGGPINIWDATKAPMPAGLRQHLAEGTDDIVAHNATFERTLLRVLLPFKIAPHRWRCTMIRALAHGMPGALGTLSEIFRLDGDTAKQKDGRALVMLFTKPRPTNSKTEWANATTHPEQWARFLDYCKHDVSATQALWAKLPGWNYPNNKTELQLAQLDAEINERGFLVDTELADAAIRAVERAKSKLNARTQELTSEEVTSATQRDKMLAFILKEHGITLPDMTASTLERRVNDESLPEELRELLRIRLQTCTTSTAKYKRLKDCVAADGRLHGTMQFCGAAKTGRVAHRMFQPGNMPRPTMKGEDIELGIQALKLGAEDLIFDNVMELASNTIRGCIIAPPGHKLDVSDLASIEGRVTMWIGGEEWELQAYRDYDAGTGPDIYRLTYAKLFNVPHESVTKDQRQIGKCCTLFFGFGGGVGAFYTASQVYGLDLEAMSKAGRAAIPSRIWDETEGAWNWATKKKITFGLSEAAYRVADSFKRLWREAHPATVELWGTSDTLFRRATNNPGVTYKYRGLAFRRDASWLQVRLPSGRRLCYLSPRIEEDNRLTCLGLNQYSRKWERLLTTPGRLVENQVQATARDILFHALPGIEAAGYKTVLTCHDEVICEAPDGPGYNHHDLSAILATNPPWAPGLPLAAAGFETYRYRKE